MENKDVYSGVPMENLPIWSQPGTTVDDYLAFDHEFSTEVEALPTLIQKRIPSISIPLEASSIQEYTSPPPLTGSLVEFEHWRDPGFQTMGPDLGSLLVGEGPDKPLEGYPPIQGSQALVQSVPLVTGNPPSGNFMGISIILGHFDHIRAKGPTAEKDSATLAVVQEDRSMVGTSNKQKGTSKRKKHLP